MLPNFNGKTFTVRKIPQKMRKFSPLNNLTYKVLSLLGCLYALAKGRGTVGSVGLSSSVLQKCNA